MQSTACKKKNLIECPKCKRIMRTCYDIEASSEDDHHLYVMSASDGYLPGIVKIGRSKNPAERACQLQEQMQGRPDVLVYALQKVVSHPTLVTELRFGCCGLAIER